MNNALETRQIIRVANGLRQFEHPNKHRGHKLRVGDAIALNGLERLLCVEFLHDHSGCAHGLDGHRPVRRRGVIQRRWIQIDCLTGDSDRCQQRREYVRRFGRTWCDPVRA